MKMKIGGAIHDVRAKNTGANLAVALNNETREYEIIACAPPKFVLRIGDSIVTGYGVRSGDRIHVHIKGSACIFEDVSQAESVVAGGGLDGEGQVVAPMPGNVIKVLVSEGELVKRHQPLVIVEAMKMENEVRAGGDAIVAKILAQAGKQVMSGEVLVELEPAKQDHGNGAEAIP